MGTDTDLKVLIDRLEQTRTLSREQWIRLIRGRTPELAEYLFEKARVIRIRHYGRDIFIRGLIEFTNYCRNDCYYCGIRRSNGCAARYRLTEKDILACCENGYRLGFRTFVLQGGEDGWYTDDRMTDIISSIHSAWPDCAITLSIGERSFESYRRFALAGADRYLLRASPSYECCSPKAVSVGSEKTRLSGGDRIYGGIPLSDPGKSGR